MNGPDEMFDHEPPRANTVDEWIGRKPDNNDTGELEQLRAIVAAVEALIEGAEREAQTSMSRMFGGEPFPGLVMADALRAALEVQP